MTEQEIIQLYVEGKSISELTRLQTTYNYRNIQKILKDNQITIRGGRKKKTLSEEQISELHKDFQNGVFLKDLAIKFGMDKETISRILNETQAPERKNHNRINKRIKSDYFSIIDSGEKAYWLGLLLTDGSVDGDKRVRLQLQARDKELLEKFKEHLGLDCSLIYDSRGSGCYSVEFTDKQIFTDLSQYGVVPNKTYNTKNLPLSKIPQKYHIDFCRGLFDGDGCLTFSKDKLDVTFHFTTYFESMAADFQILVDSIINKTEHNNPYFTSCWHVQWRGRQQVLKILDYLYENSTIHLKRKYDKYIELKQSK